MSTDFKKYPLKSKPEDKTDWLSVAGWEDKRIINALVGADLSIKEIIDIVFAAGWPSERINTALTEADVPEDMIVIASFRK